MELLGSSPIPRSFVASCVSFQLRPLPSTGVTRLHRYNEPLRHPKRPGLSLASCQLIVDPHRDHRWDFPCCAWSPLPTCRRQYPGRLPAQRSLTLRPVRSPGRLATHCTRGFSSLVASTAALIATGWSEPVPGRVYPRCGPAPFTAHDARGLDVE